MQQMYQLYTTQKVNAHRRVGFISLVAALLDTESDSRPALTSVRHFSMYFGARCKKAIARNGWLQHVKKQGDRGPERGDADGSRFPLLAERGALSLKACVLRPSDMCHTVSSQYTHTDEANERVTERV
jgi:hypothetical protein